jgi:O-antigen ligase
MRFFRSPSFPWQLFQFSFISLPYLYFAVFPGLVGVIGLLWVKFRHSALDQTTRNLLVGITGLLLLSCLFAADSGEAFLQLANFLPYILLFSVLPYILKGTEPLQQLALSVVIATIPINALAILEYALRHPGLPRWLKRTALSRWYRARPHAERAMVMFGHPNALAGYLVLVLGLGLGLILYYSLRNRLDAPASLLARLQIHPKTLLILLHVGTFSCLLGIFASGSRNGLIVAVSQLLVFSLFTKASRAILLAGLAGLAALVTGAAVLGIGGRSLSVVDWANDPRVGVWQFGLDLLRQRPWLGWGLGNFKLQYPPGLVPEYDYIAHPHNFWLLLAVEAGIPVLLLFTGLVGRICYRSMRQLLAESFKFPNQAILLAYLLSFWGCLAFALFDVSFYDARINVTNWVVLAGLYSLTRQASFYPDKETGNAIQIGEGNLDNQT